MREILLKHGAQFLEEARERHSAYFLDLLKQISIEYDDRGNVTEGLKLFEQERRNVQTGQEWARSNIQNSPSAARLAIDYASAGSNVTALRLSPHDWIVWLEAAVAAHITLGDQSRQAHGLANLGLAWLRLGEPQRALENLEPCLEIARPIKDLPLEANTLGALGLASNSLGDVGAGVECLELIC